MISKENYARNVLMSYITFDEEAIMLHVSIPNPDVMEEILHRVNMYDYKNNYTADDIRKLVRKMNIKLWECQHEIDGYSH